MGLPWESLCLLGDSSMGQGGWRQANVRKGIAYLLSRNLISSVCFMVVAPLRSFG